MRVYFSDMFLKSYSLDPAAAQGRLEPAVERLALRHEVVAPEALSPELLLTVHTAAHVESVRRQRRVWRAVLLATGAGLAAARSGLAGEPAFALVRPPGHHAAADAAWGFCHVNNVAVAVGALLAEGAVKRVVILDFDLHLGDGTQAIFAAEDRVVYLHPEGGTPADYLRDCVARLEAAGDADILAVSAGFDRHVYDWGGTLETRHYRTLGRHLVRYAEAHCGGRRFAVLEGGYNPAALAEAVDAFLESFGESTVEAAPAPMPVVSGPLHVVAYSGYRGEEAPRAFELGGRGIIVTAIVRRWVEPSGDRYFVVRGNDGRRYELVHRGASGAWEMGQARGLRPEA